ncbi:hypothetical protein ACHAXT_001330 [Thalassiosira profunda]
MMEMIHKIEDFDDCVESPREIMFDPAYELPSPVHCAPMTVDAAATTTASHDKRPARLVSAPLHDEPHLVAPPTHEEAAPITGRLSSIEHRYRVDPQVLGTGHHGSVRRCVDRATGRSCAVKSIRKDEPTVKPGGLRREIALLQEMNHANVVQLIDVFEDSQYVHLVTDLCEGGELFDRIVDRSNEANGVPCFTEREAATVVRQILEAIAHVHSKGVAHRDIKPENILFETTAADSRVKLIDFGLSRKHHSNQPPMRTIVGTPYYVAGEVLRKSYDRSCDLWSVGVVAYILLCGYPPFNGANAEQTHKSVLRGKYCFPAEDWKDVDREALDFINSLLQVNPRRRMTAAQALRHPWIAKHNAVANAEARTIPRPLRVRDRSPPRRLDADHESPRRPLRKGGESPPRRKLRVSTFGL